MDPATVKELEQLSGTRQLQVHMRAGVWKLARIASSALRPVGADDVQEQTAIRISANATRRRQIL